MNGDEAMGLAQRNYDNEPGHTVEVPAPTTPRREAARLCVELSRLLDPENDLDFSGTAVVYARAIVELLQ